MNLVKTYCDKQKCSHIYTCAKTGYGVDEIFENLNTKILKKVNSAEKNYGISQISESDEDDNYVKLSDYFKKIKYDK